MRFDPDKQGLCSGSDVDSDSGDEDEPVGSVTDGRRGSGVKRERAEMEAREAGLPSQGFGVLAGGVAGAKPGKKTRGRVKIKMEFIDNKLRRYTTFSKRKTGIMKKVGNFIRTSFKLHPRLLFRECLLLSFYRSVPLSARHECVKPVEPSVERS